MSVKKLSGVLLLVFMAIAITIVYNSRFPKYGNTYSNIAAIASERDWLDNLIYGSNVKICEVTDAGSYRIAVVEPVDTADERFGCLYFKRNSSGNYEIRGTVTWTSDDLIQVMRLETDEGSYDVIMYNNHSVVLIQRSSVSGYVENKSVSSGNIITLWEAQNGYTYKCLTISGTTLTQK